MNIALIIAGGKGVRTGMDVPKQFVCVKDKPIIVYTLEAFQHHPNIDKLLVVCLEGWHDILHAYVKQFKIDKLQWVISGGHTSQESIRNGIYHLETICKADDIVVIHDGIRPLVEDSVLSDVIVKCKVCGNAVSSLPYNEQIFVTEDSCSTTKYIPRDILRRVSTPQAYKYELLLKSYRKAFAENIGTSVSSYTNTMMVDLGETLYFAAGSEKNIKLTTTEDIEIFKAFLSTKKDSYINS